MKLETIKRPKKAEAFSLVAKLHEGRKLTAYETSLLVNYFSPPLPVMAKTALQYVAKAVDPEHKLENMRYVHVADGLAYATDGTRMHWAPVNLENGAYSAKTCAAVEGVDSDATVTTIRMLIDDPGAPVGAGKLETAKLVTLKPTWIHGETVVKLDYGAHIQLPYLLDAINREKMFEYTVHTHKVMFECKLGKAFVSMYRL